MGSAAKCLGFTRAECYALDDAILECPRPRAGFVHARSWNFGERYRYLGIIV